MRFTQTPTPSITATPSITPSITPTQTPTGTVCPGLTPTATRTPTQTQTQTGTLPVTPTQTQTQTAALQPTPTPSVTPSNCLCFSTTYEEIPEGLQVRWRDCETGTVLTQDISTLLQRDNLDGTFTSFICVAQGLSYETPVCVLDGIEVTCDPLIWVEGGACSDSIDCDVVPCACYLFTNTTETTGEVYYTSCLGNSPVTSFVEPGLTITFCAVYGDPVTATSGTIGGLCGGFVQECGDDGDCSACDVDPNDCLLYEIDNSAGGFEISWTGLLCITGAAVGGTVPANTVINTGCIIDGTLNYTGSPIISIIATC